MCNGRCENVKEQSWNNLANVRALYECRLVIATVVFHVYVSCFTHSFGPLVNTTASVGNFTLKFYVAVRD